tara:strand:+ start:4013 stop:4411 length:399 start_codon:yes stop_codon:yes gene_type:complete
MNISNYEEDLEKREKGSPLHIEDGSFDVKRFNTPESNIEIETIKKREYGFAPKDMDHNKIIAIWLSEHGVTGWDGVFDDEKELKYSKQTARQIFLNPAYYLSLNALLLQHACDYSNYLHDEIEEDIAAIKKN